MSGSFMRQVNDALMPEGAVWTPEYGGYYDRFLDGCADNAQRALDDLDKLAYIRDPRRVPRELLPDLEREYGISPDDAIPEGDRRAELAVERYGGRRLALVGRLQAALDKTGFGSGGYGLIVTPNAAPAINPGLIIGNPFFLSAHEFPTRHCAGNATAYAGQAGGGYYLVSGDRFNAVRAGPQAGYVYAQAYPSASCAGYYEGERYSGYVNEYVVPPDDPRWWPFVFFVGGTVTRDEDGTIAGIVMVEIPASLHWKLHRLILRYKPLHSWAGLRVRYV